jgi:hypothetical protein
MFEPLLQADTSFAPLWTAFQSEWEGEPDTSQYLALAALARHLIEQLQSGKTANFAGVFDVVERWHVDGDPDVREAATIGLLESLQNEGLHGTTRPSDFVPWLRPQSRMWWDRVTLFWSEGRPIREG